MKWVAGTLALLAVVSGCVSLNKGSDQVALLDSGKGAAEEESLSIRPAPLPAETVSAALNKAERQRESSRRDADVKAETSVASLPPSPDLQGERASSRVVRASPPEMVRAQARPAVAEPSAASETKDTELPANTAVASANDVRLPTIINGSVEAAPAAPAAPAVMATPMAPADPPAARPTAAAVRMVNSKRISLNYEIKDVGPSGVSMVELWYTQDGRRWEKYDTASQPRPPFVVELRDEGLYGFTLVARNGVGLGKRPPRSGDQPQVWVEVDTIKPVVRLLDVQVGVSGEGQHLSIRWKATDTNLGQRPITLAYAEQPAGPWTVITSNVENSGSYAWQLPSGVPPRLMVRVEATDLVGNVGIAQMPEPIALDLSQPSISILAVEAAVK